ncbi:MAG: tetratricopeptide repeat protein [Holosporales bacterium]|jgi:hypothetical protein|nr:tetratricopeptide repeat protein [Holosporales bacterium]
MNEKKDNNTIQKVDAFIDSIEEEIRNENWQDLWSRYSKYISGAFIILTITIGGYGSWKKRELAKNEAISHRYSIIQNSIIKGDIDEAIPQLKELSKISKNNYSALAKFEYASILRSKNDKKAADQYKQISDDKKAHKIFRELAYVFYVHTCLDLLSQAELKLKLDEIIKTLSGKYIGCDCNLLVMEALAFCYIKQNKNDLAKQTLINLAKTNGIPQCMQERARILLNYIENRGVL